MLRLVFSLLFLFVTSVVCAANVEWNGFVFYHETGYGGNEFYTVKATKTIAAGERSFIGFYELLSGNNAELFSSNGNGVLDLCNMWVVANKGDVLDYHYFDSKATCFSQSNLFGGESGKEKNSISITVQEGQDIYLAVALADSPVNEIFYGWGKFKLENGVLEYVGSAVDLDGGSIIVGEGTVIPEPSGSVLFLFGGALLALRRRIGGVSGNKSSIASRSHDEVAL